MPDAAYPFQPGKHFRTDTMAAARQAVQALLEHARYRVDILSPQLDHQLYDQAPVIDALRRVVVDGSRYARIRILVADPAAIVQRGHRLMHLARKLSTAMEIRQLAIEDRNDPPSWLTVDDHGYARWDPTTDYAGIFGRDCRSHARQQERWFTEFWSRSVPDQSLRQLHL